MTDDLRERCCWKRCRQPSDLVFLGVGICQAHYSQACTVFKPTYQYILDHATPAAAGTMEANAEYNRGNRGKA